MPYIPTLPPSRADEPRPPETSKPLGGSPIPGKAVLAVPAVPVAPQGKPKQTPEVMPPYVGRLAIPPEATLLAPEPEETEPTARPSKTQAAADAEYARRAQEALASVCRPDYPQGMILWLGEASPRLYAELTERLPGEIHRLWSEHAPLEKFQAILDRWKQTHAQACVLYRAHLAARKPGEAKGRVQ